MGYYSIKTKSFPLMIWLVLLGLAAGATPNDYLDKRICVVYHSVNGLENESPDEVRTELPKCAKHYTLATTT